MPGEQGSARAEATGHASGVRIRHVTEGTPKHLLIRQVGDEEGGGGSVCGGRGVGGGGVGGR